MGNDPDATRWIRQFRVSPPDGEAGGRRINRRRGGPGAAVAVSSGRGDAVPSNGAEPVLSADVPGVDVPGLDVPANS
jgi:hypothetical protein